MLGSHINQKPLVRACGGGPSSDKINLSIMIWSSDIVEWSDLQILRSLHRDQYPQNFRQCRFIGSAVLCPLPCNVIVSVIVHKGACVGVRVWTSSSASVHVSFSVSVSARVRAHVSDSFSAQCQCQCQCLCPCSYLYVCSCNMNTSLNINMSVNITVSNLGLLNHTTFRQIYVVRRFLKSTCNTALLLIKA
jgi:hypothetical protein